MIEGLQFQVKSSELEELLRKRVAVLKDRIAKTEVALANVGKAGQARKEIEGQLDDVDLSGLAPADDEVAARMLGDQLKLQKKAYEHVAFLAGHVVPSEIYRIGVEELQVLFGGPFDGIGGLYPRSLAGMPLRAKRGFQMPIGIPPIVG